MFFNKIFKKKNEKKLLEKANTCIVDFLKNIDLSGKNIVYLKTHISVEPISKKVRVTDNDTYGCHIIFIETSDQRNGFFDIHDYSFESTFFEFFSITERIQKQINDRNNEDIFYSGILEIVEPEYADEEYLFKLSYINNINKLKDNCKYSEGRVLSNIMAELNFNLNRTKTAIVDIPIFEEYSPYFDRMPKNIIEKYFQYLRDKEMEYKSKLNELERKKDALSDEMHLLFEIDK